MRFLPIVDRELREGSRRPVTYWRRVGVAFLALLIGGAAYVENYFEPQAKLGTLLFWGLSGMSMIFCLFAGRGLTADCLSREKREGTLGLLFLTDLKGYDVVLGKLVATSLSGFYALLAVFPVLAIPLLAGGMTNGEFWRMVLVLLNTFFYSLAIGVLASAVTREYRAAMAANFFLFALVLGGLAACGLIVGAEWHQFLPPLFYLCPVYPFVLCADRLYATMAANFWWSVGLTHLLAWLFVALACSIVPHAWTDKPAVAASGRWRWREIGPLLNYGGPAQRAAFRKKALDANAFFWLAGRARLKPVHVWVFMGLAAIWWLNGWFQSGHFWVEPESFLATAVILNASFKAWILLEAGHQLGEDRRSGAFELLLVTPLTVGDILAGQWRALRRQFLRPLLLVVAVELIFAATMARRHNLNQQVYSLLAIVLMLVADVVALIWVAMAAALTARSQTRATLTTVFRILVAPWVAFAGVLAVRQAAFLLDLTKHPPNDAFPLHVWLWTGLLADLVYGLHAWRSLRRDFREMAVRPLVAERGQFRWWQFPGKAAAAVARFAGRFLAPRFRKLAIASLAAVLALAGVLLARSRPKFPPPVVVSITQSNAPLAVFPVGEGVFLVLPDGTLWCWGRPGPTNIPRAALPERVDAATNWVKAMGSMDYCLGLRADGTVWEWGNRNGHAINAAHPALPGHDWIDAETGWNHAIALRKDGTIWGWDDRSAMRTPAVNLRPKQWGQIGAASNWTAVSTCGGATLALRADGTLWAWGQISSSRGGSYWMNTNLTVPTLVCAETNWIGLEANGLVRNRAGELWDAGFVWPDAQTGASSVCTLVSPNWATDRAHSVAFRMKAQVRSNGTLWVASRPWIGFPPSSQEWRQIGSRSDWLGVWLVGGTSFGLTSDGTFWAWGFDLGAEPVLTFEARLGLLKERLGGRSWVGGNFSPPILKEPRPLLRLVPSK